MQLCHAMLLIFLLTPCLAAADGPLTVAGWTYALEKGEGRPPGPPVDGWIPVAVPGMIKTGCRRQRPICYAWFRGEFVVSGDPAAYYGISLGRTFHTDEVFINGAFIDSQVPEDFANIHFPSSYVIPAGVVVSGKNVLLVRLGIYGDQWGGLLEEVRILPKREYILEKMFYETVFDKVPLGIVISLTALLVLILVFYFWNRKNAIFLYGAMILLVMILYIITLFSPFELLLIPFDLIFVGHWLFYPVMSLLVVMFIQSLYRKYFFFQNILVAALFGVVSAVMVVSPVAADGFSILPVCGGVTGVLFTGYVAYILKNLPSDRRQDSFKFNGIVLLVVVSQLAAAWDIIAYCTGGRTMLLMLAMGTLFVSLIISILGGRDVYNRLRAMQHLYDSLKSRIDKRPLSITNESEDKLNQVIDFIKDNYRSDMSREGLAEAVGMNPDYMSKLFRAYTGMKINEYINRLRVEEAAARIGSDNAKIIDIAFTVGFENIVSFNRSFKAVMDLTPSEYRARIRAHN